MAYPSVTIGGTELTAARLVSVAVSQTLNEHWRATVALTQTADDPIPVDESLGEPLVVTSQDATGATLHHFTGFVVTSKLIYEASGTFSAVLTAVTKTWLMDQAMRHQHFPEQGLAARSSLSISVKTPDGKPINYVQYGETNFSLLHRIVDDHNAWMRPNETGLEVFDSFQPGCDLT